MFLYVGGVTNILFKNIISIHDYDVFVKTNNDYILRQFDENDIVWLADKKDIKSIIFTDNKIYMSAISALTLKKRSGSFFGN